MNGRFELHINTQPHSEVYCGYFRRLACGNSLTFSHIPPCYHAKPPDFPRLIGPRDTAKALYSNMTYSTSVTIGQCISICIGHSGGDVYFICYGPQ